MGNIATMENENKKYQTFKLRIGTLKKIRMLHAVTGKAMMDLVDDWVTEELQKRNLVIPGEEERDVKT